MSLIVVHDCDCGENHQASDLDELDEICPAYISCVASTTDLIEELRARGAEERQSFFVQGISGAVHVHKPGRYLVFSLEGEK